MELDIERLEDLMARERMSYEDLALATGISRTTIFRMRGNPTNVKLGYINRLSEVFDVDPFTLLKR